MQHATRQSVRFEGRFQKPVAVAFDATLQSSDAGSLLLASTDRKLGLTHTSSREITDQREARKVRHHLGEILRQRINGSAPGYPDGNGSARIGHDPLLEPTCGRSVADEQGLASQPTPSRFEPAVGGRELVGMGRSLEAAVIRQLKRRHPRARLITIDLDTTDDPTHGQNEVLWLVEPLPSCARQATRSSARHRKPTSSRAAAVLARSVCLRRQSWR